MANPLYHDDPDWYERPGETVHLEVDQKPALFTVPALPWRDRPSRPTRAGHLTALFGGLSDDGITPRCVVCGRNASHHSLLCQFCARAQAADETAKARANVPQPSAPRIRIREAWESWSLAQAAPTPEGPTIREYETRLD